MLIVGGEWESGKENKIYVKKKKKINVDLVKLGCFARSLANVVDSSLMDVVVLHHWSSGRIFGTGSSSTGVWDLYIARGGVRGGAGF